jgi:hypothetical protein
LFRLRMLRQSGVGEMLAQTEGRPMGLFDSIKRTFARNRSGIPPDGDRGNRIVKLPLDNDPTFRATLTKLQNTKMGR